jgi:hypothetical protein
MRNRCNTSDASSIISLAVISTEFGRTPLFSFVFHLNLGVVAMLSSNSSHFSMLAPHPRSMNHARTMRYASANRDDNHPVLTRRWDHSWDHGCDIPPHGVTIDQRFHHRERGRRTLEVKQLLCKVRVSRRLPSKAHPENVAPSSYKNHSALFSLHPIMSLTIWSTNLTCNITSSRL